MQKSEMLGVKVHVINKKQLFDKMIDILREDVKFPKIINCVNAHALNICQDDSRYREILNKSEIVYCDGFGVVLAARILNLKIGERMTPTDWMPEFFNEIIKLNKTVFFLGDVKEVNDKYKEQTINNNPALMVTGNLPGHFKLFGNENEAVISQINNAKPDILLVGMGMPIQEKWAFDNYKKLNVKLIIPVGALFRLHIGEISRAPQLITNNGLEWLSRLVYDPKKVWKRYLFGLPQFLFKIIKYKYSNPSI